MDNTAVTEEERTFDESTTANEKELGMIEGIEGLKGGGSLPNEDDDLALGPGEYRMIPLHEFKLRIALSIVENIPDGVVLDKS